MNSHSRWPWPSPAGARATYQRSQDTERQVARLTLIIRGFQEDGCPLDSECRDPARHLAEEIIARRLAWE